LLTGLWDPAYIFFLWELEYSAPLFLIKDIGGRRGGGGGRRGREIFNLKGT